MTIGKFDSNIWHFGDGQSRNAVITIKQDVVNVNSPIRIKRTTSPHELLIEGSAPNSRLMWMTFGDNYLLVLESEIPPNNNPYCIRKVFVIDTQPKHTLKKIEIINTNPVGEPYVTSSKVDGDIFLIYLTDMNLIAHKLAFHRSDNGQVICQTPSQDPKLVGGRSIYGMYDSFGLLSMKFLNPIPGLPPLPNPCQLKNI
jgi:hypothetical protein